MTPVEIFSEIHKHQIHGVMFHDELASLYDFMGMRGYKRQHEYRSLCEFVEARSISRYAINHLNKLLLDDTNIAPSKIIPSQWKSATRFDLGESDRKSYIKECYKRWRSWETETKAFYQTKFKDLTAMGEISCADKVNEMILDVDMELKHLEREYIALLAVGFDMTYIMEKQDEIHEEYAEKEKDIGVSFN